MFLWMAVVAGSTEYLVVDYFLAMPLLIAYRSSHFLIWLGGEDPHPPNTPPCAHEVRQGSESTS
jgi:hypothetical protein